MAFPVNVEEIFCFIADPTIATDGSAPESQHCFTTSEIGSSPKSQETPDSSVRRTPERRAAFSAVLVQFFGGAIGGYSYFSPAFTGAAAALKMIHGSVYISLYP